MKQAIGFVLGAGVGVCVTLYAIRQRVAAPAVSAVLSAAAAAALVGSLLHQLAEDPDAPFGSPAPRELACLVRQDPRVAGQVRDRLLNSPSETERHKLMRLLAQDSSPETSRLVGRLLSGPDGPAERLGFDLLRSLDGPGVRPELTSALLAATQQERNPEYLADLIATLDHQPLDAASRGVPRSRSRHCWRKALRLEAPAL